RVHTEPLTGAPRSRVTTVVSFQPSAKRRQRWSLGQRLRLATGHQPLRTEDTMHKPIKYVEKAVTIGAKGVWAVFERVNRIKQNPSPKPKWSDKPLLKSYQKTKPPLGWPRTTDSLCPKCVPEIRQQILDGKLPVEVLSNSKIGEIKAEIIERDGKIIMVKDCAIHGHFEDVMSIDTDFSRHLEEVFPGRDIVAHNDEKLHHH